MLWLIAVLLAPPTPAAEVARLERWFAQAKAIVHAHAPASDAARQARRAALIEALADYVDGGLFPTNQSPGWAPVFVDADDTRCAMAHLLDVTGEGALMRRVAAMSNRAEVIDLIDEPELQAWLDWHGLTAAEAAAIQPAYPGPTQPTCLCGDDRYGDHLQPSSVIEVVPEGDALRVVDVFSNRTQTAYEVDDRVEYADLELGRLRGESPYLIAVFNTRGAQLPYSEPCPAITPYPGTPPPPLTHAQMASAALAGPECQTVLAKIDSRWGYTTEGCDGCSASAPDAPVTWMLLLLALVRRRPSRRNPSRRRGAP